jgi:hypothetical protein
MLALCIWAARIVKNILKHRETFVTFRLLCCGRAGGLQNMRILVAMLMLSAVALPCSGRTILKSEPLVLAPYEVAYVQDVSCPTGKVLKVTGAIRGLHRKRECVALSGDQASLAVAVP